MYLEQRVEKLESRIARLEAEIEEYRVKGSVKAETPSLEEKDTRPVKVEVISEPEQPTYPLDDVRAKVTEVMKADKTKKAALQALLKKHGTQRVSELEESKFAAVIDAIEKGGF